MTLLVGWREWVALPDLGVARIKAKVDTGARTSALHAVAIEPCQLDGQAAVRFQVQPVQGDDSISRSCRALLVDERQVRDSGGHVELRPVVRTHLQLGGVCWEVELTLTARVDMRFRMLLGRTALKGRFHVDPGRSYLQGRASVPATGNVSTSPDPARASDP